MPNKPMTIIQNHTTPRDSSGSGTYAGHHDEKLALLCHGRNGADICQGDAYLWLKELYARRLVGRSHH